MKLPTSEQVASLFGQNQIVTALWLFRGGIEFNSGSSRLSINDRTGITLEDRAGNIAYSVPLSSRGPFLFGTVARDIETPALVNIGEGSVEGVSDHLTIFPKALAVLYNPSIETQISTAAGIYFHAKHPLGLGAYGVALEAAAIGNCISPQFGIYGAVIRALSLGTGGSTILQGLFVDVQAYSNSTNMGGLQTQCIVQAGTTASLIGTQVSTSVLSGAAVTSLLGVSVEASILGTVGYFCGFRVAQSLTGGSVTTAYGIVITALAGTTMYSLYSGVGGAALINAGSGIFGGTSNETSAVLQAHSTSKGFLPPRMTTAQKGAISSPATGLIVYDTDLGRLEFYNGAAWGAV